MSIQVGGKKIPAMALQCSPKEGGRVLRAFAEKHPAQVKSFSRFLGYATDGSLADITAMGERLIFMRFSPT